ncbi:MAG: FtsQ-type POTRA domain-containing protein [Acidimicrobiia bacterium]
MTRAAGRRRLRRLLVVVVLLAAAGVVAGIVWSPFLDVDKVTIVGAGERGAEVRAAVAVDRGSPLLLVDTDAAEERIEALAWVGDAEVSRELPGTLAVAVAAPPPVAVAGPPDGQVALVDATGIVVGVVRTAPGGLAALVTSTPPPEAGDRIRPAAAAEVAGAIGPLAGRVARVSVDDGRAALLLVDGVEVRLGNLDRLAEKARAADAVLGAPGVAGIAYVDVSVPSAPVTG